MGGSMARGGAKVYLYDFPNIKDDWDEKYGDRINQVVFIGKGYEKSQIVELVNNCIEKEYLA